MNANRTLTLVTVGNAKQPFQRLLDSVAQIADQLPQPLIVQRGTTPFSSPIADVRTYIKTEEFVSLLNSAALVICHAGAGTIIQAVRTGRRPVVMPRLARFGEHVDDHQVEFARALAEEGKVVLVETKEELENACHSMLVKQQSRTNAGPSTKILEVIAKTLARYATIQR